MCVTRLLLSGVLHSPEPVASELVRSEPSTSDSGDGRTTCLTIACNSKPVVGLGVGVGDGVGVGVGVETRVGLQGRCCFKRRRGSGEWASYAGGALVRRLVLLAPPPSLKHKPAVVWKDRDQAFWARLWVEAELDA